MPEFRVTTKGQFRTCDFSVWDFTENSVNSNEKYLSDKVGLSEKLSEKSFSDNLGLRKLQNSLHPLRLFILETFKSIQN